MTYAIADLDKLITTQYGDDVPYSGGSSYPEDETETDAWCMLYKALLNNEALPLPGLGYAYLADADVDGKDYWTEGEIWFVFKVTAADQPVRYFRRVGYHSSYEGRHFDGPTTEVAGTPVIKTNWSNV